MDEVALCRFLLVQALEIARAHGSARIERMTVEIGALTDLVPAQLADAFLWITAGTAAEGAELIIETIPATARCRGCGHFTHPAASFLTCNACGSDAISLLSGQEQRLASIVLSSIESVAVCH